MAELEQKETLQVQPKTLTDQAPTTIWNPLFINIVIVNIAMNFGQFMMGTLVSKFADSLGASASMVGLVTSLFTVTALAVKPISGPAIDSLPKKKILVGAVLTIMAAFVTYSLAHSVTTIIIARLIHGIGMGFTAATCLALVCEALPSDKITQGISYFTLGQAMVSAVGPAIGLSLASRFGYNQTFAIGAMVMAGSAVLAATMKTPPKLNNKAFKISINNMFAKEAIIPATLTFFLSLASSANMSFLVLYAQKDRGVTSIGLWFTVSALCLLITRPVIGKLADRYGIHQVMLPSFVLFGVSLFIISISTNIYLFLISAVFNACGFGAIIPTNQALCMKCVTPDRRGVGGSTNYIGTDLGFFIGPIIAGMLVANFGYSTMYRLMIIPIVIAAIVFVIVYPKIKAICVK